MVKARLQSLVPSMVAATQTWRDRSSLRFYWRLLLIGMVVFVLSGWSQWPDGLGIVLLVLIFAMVLLIPSQPSDRDAISRWQHMGLILLLSVGLCAFLAIVAGTVDSEQAWFALAFGTLVAGYLKDGIEASRYSRRRDALARGMDELTRGVEPVFDPRWTIKSADDRSVWAIDPARRALRVMIPAQPDVDEILAWDAPIRSVSLDRLPGSSRWPIFGNTARFVRRDRDLRVAAGTGRDQWTFTLPFYGTDLEQARLWRDTFESWMRQDERAADATASR